MRTVRKKTRDTVLTDGAAFSFVVRLTHILELLERTILLVLSAVAGPRKTRFRLRRTDEPVAEIVPNSQPNSLTFGSSPDDPSSAAGPVLPHDSIAVGAASCGS